MSDADERDATRSAVATTIHAGRRGDAEEQTDEPNVDAGETGELRRAAEEGPSLARESRRRRLAQRLFGVAEQEPVRLGRFVLLEPLGEGGMGTVHVAYDPQLDRRVALKLLRTAQGSSRVLRARMLREAKALARLSHPNVVPVHDAGVINEQVFIVMEYVRGRTLRRWVEESRPSWRELLNVYVQAGQGLAAAHASGVIHRDFKPDNAICGDDGRVRVLDFGIARGVEREGGPALEPAGVHVGASSGAALHDARLTVTGAVMGTPAYMAPEQFVGATTDARTDQYSFCASLYEALYGEQPFAGDSFVERRRSVTGGLVRPPPEGTQVPDWVRAVLLRGLEYEQAARYPDMASLLAALLADPDQLRRRRLRSLGGAALLVLLTVALILGAMEGWARWRAHRQQAAARERVAALDARLDGLVAEGRRDEARRVFRQFVEQPDIRGTAAEGRAWLHEATRERAADDERAAVDAFGTAYTVATSADDQVAALVGLATFLRHEYRWEQLAEAMATIERREADDREDPAVHELQLSAALGRRDLGAAVSLLDSLGDERRARVEPIVRALSRATRTERSAVDRILHDGDRDELVFVEGRSEGPVLAFTSVSPALQGRATIEVASAPSAMVPRPDDDPLFLTQRARGDGGDGRELALLERDGDGLREVYAWPEHALLTTLNHDFDGDGVRNTYLGIGPYHRRVIELVRPGQGRPGWTVRNPSPALAWRSSDAVSLLAGDLDGDGVDELVAALGPWTAYELHVLRYAPASNTFETITRRKLGNILLARLIRRQVNGPLEIVVIKNDDYTNAALFPPDRPTGDPDGLYLYRLQDGALEQTAYIDNERLLDHRRRTHQATLAADVDGDGREELIVAFSAGHEPVATTLIYPSDERGELLPPIAIGSVWLREALDLDGDGDDELLVERSEDPARRLWALGSGDESIPPVVSQRVGLVGIDIPANTTLPEMWRRARDLEMIGLPEQAAAGFAALADLATDRVERAQARLVAARLYDALGDDARATTLYGDAIEEPSLTAEATEGAARGALRQGDYAGALATIERGLATGGALAGEARRRVEAERVRLAALVSGEQTAAFRFDRPLAAGWQVARPLSLRRDSMARALHVTTIGTGPIAARVMNWSTEHVAIEVDLELLRGEWNADFQVTLVPAARPGGENPYLGARVRFEGGASTIVRHLKCHWGPEVDPGTTIAAPEEPGSKGARFRVRSSIDLVTREATCRISTVDGELLHYSRRALGDDEDITPQQLRLMFTSSMNTDHERMSVAVHGVTVYGATPAPEPAAAGLPRVEAALVEGESAELLRALDELEEAEPDGVASTRAALWRVMALAELHRVDEAAAALTSIMESWGVEVPVKEDAGVVKEQRWLKDLLRLRPGVMAPVLLKAVGPAGAIKWVEDVWYYPFMTSPFDDEPTRVLRGALAQLESLELSTREQLECFGLRAVVYARLNMDGHARRDIKTVFGILDGLDDDQGAALGWGGEPRELLEFQYAAAAARDGDLETAREIVARLTAGGPYALLFVDQVRAYPEFAPLRDEVHDP